MVAVGGYHTAVVTVDGQLYTWGDDEYGQLGTGSTVNQLQPVPVSLPAPVTMVAVGSGNTAAVTADGQLYTWGYGGDGQLGTGSTENQLRPVPIALPA